MTGAMMTKILMSVVATTMIFQLALAVDHNVGRPGGGWDTSTDFESWASNETFTVGDNLVFTYTGSHSVLEVTKDNYDSCTTLDRISTNLYSPTTFELTDAGNRYFICGTSGHCEQGMKVAITMNATPSGPPTTGTPSSGNSPAPPATKESPKPGSAATVQIMSVVSMVGFGFLMMI